MISLSEMTEAAGLLVEAERKTADAETALKEAKERERVLREETLPGMMSELGVEKLTLQDGSVISVKQEVYASIPEHRKTEAYGWVEQHGFGGIIKTTVAVPFSKGEMATAMTLLSELQANGFEAASLDRSIHPQTLKSFLRERIAEMADDAERENGTPVPMELFGARPVMAAKVTAAKAKV